MRDVLRTAARAAVREPLTGFVLLGALLFGLDAALARGADDLDDDRAVVVGRARIEDLVRRAIATSGREPDPDELDALVARLVRDEVLAREARAFGLDRGDLIVERRLVQKMEFLLAGTVDVPPPDDVRVRAYLDAHPERARVPGRLTLDHLLFASRRADALADAREALTALEGGADPQHLGDPSSSGARLAGVTASALASRLGDGVARAAIEAPLGRWVGPIRGERGVHLLRVEAREPERVASLGEVRGPVAIELERAARDDAVRAAIDAIVAAYDVRIEARQ